MRSSQLFTKTSKTTPADEASKNAQLLIKAGYIHKEMAGVYSFLPLGKRVVDNIAAIVRKHMDDLGGQEVKMSILQSKDLWQLTDRWDDKKVDVWLKTKLSSAAEAGLGFTNEEPLTNALLPFVNSYRDLPLYIYQIQYKFRNEPRAKSGLLRGREFMMKDLYSFSRTPAEHQAFYEKIAASYLKIYEEVGLGEITVRTFASGGVFSKYSDEFQTLSDIGEDTIYVSEVKKLAVNKEVLNDEVLNDLGLNRDDLVEKRAVEVGNIFHLSSKYSDALGLYYIDEQGSRQSIVMGSYGIGISRLMGLIAEHFADDKGLVWPENIAPFRVYLARLGNEEAVVKQADEIYNRLVKAGVEVLYDDRDTRAGEKFADADLLGIPFRLVVSQATVTSGMVELKKRSSSKTKTVSLDKILTVLD